MERPYAFTEDYHPTSVHYIKSKSSHEHRKSHTKAHSVVGYSLLHTYYLATSLIPF